MARKRLNKTLVGWLTGGAIVLTVAVVAVATYNAARDDPEVLARKAQQADQAGNYERALRYYARAFRASKDGKYLVLGAAMAYKQGDIPQALLLLAQAHAQNPDDPEVLRALLQRYWEFRRYGFVRWQDVLEYAEALLKQQPDDPLALACKVVALDTLSTQSSEYADYADEAAQTLERAFELAPTDPRIAQLQAMRLLREAQQHAAREAARPGADRQELRQQLAEAYDQAIEVLQAALQAHGESVELRTLLARTLSDAGRIDEAIAVLDAGLERNPDEPALHYERALHILRKLASRSEALDDAQRLELARRGLADAERTIELAPAYYEAYSVRSDLQRLVWRLDGTWEKQPGKCQTALLQSFVAGLENTVNLKSARAVLGREQRARMIVLAFDSSIRAYQRAEDPELKKELLNFARRFLNDAQTQYRESFVVPLMEGQLALIDGDAVAAIRAFEQALEKLGATTSRFSIMCHEQLARLYAQQGQLGTSLTHADEALQQYAALRSKPPLWLIVHKANILTATDRAAEALDLLDAARDEYPDNDELKTARARALTVLGRTEEARQVAAQIKGAGVRERIARARIFAAQKDYDAAARELEQVLAQQPQNMEAIRLYSQVQVLAGRREQLVAWLEKRAGEAEDPMFARTLRAIAVTVSTDDPQQRDAALLKLIQEIEDPRTRYAELVNFYASRDQYDQALENLAELIRLEGETPELIRMRFQLALRRKDFAAAEKDLPRLAELDVDHAGGEIFRAQLAQAKGDVPTAIQHLRNAEQRLPQDAHLKLMLARALLMLPDPQYDEAIKVLEQAIASDPRNFEAYKLMYICYEQSGRRSEGIGYLEKAAELNRNDPFIQQRAELLEEQRNPQQGIARREQIRRENPADVDNLLRLAELYARVGRTQDARACVLEAVERAPAERRVAVFATRFFARLRDRAAGEQALRKHIEAVDQQADKPALRVTARLMLARFYDTLGQAEAALAALKDARELVERMEGLDDATRLRLKVVTGVELAEHYARAQALEDVIRTYQQVLDWIGPQVEAYPDIVRQARLKQLRALLSLGRFDEFDQKVDAYLDTAPDDVEALKLKAESLIKRNRYEDAEVVLSRVLNDHPDDTWALYARGRVYIELRRYPEARRDLARLKQIAPDAFEYRPRFDLARIYELTGQVPMAEAELRELVEQRPDDRALALQYVGLLIRTDQVEKAQEFVNSRIARKPDDPFWYIQLGRLLLQREQYSAAVLPLRQALERGADRDATVLADWMKAMIQAGRAAEVVAEARGWDEKKLIPAIRTYLAEALLRTGQAEQATAQMRQALLDAARRSALSVHFVSRRATEVLGREQAIDLLRDVLEDVPPDTPAAWRIKDTIARRLVDFGTPEAYQQARALIDELFGQLPQDHPLRLDVELLHAHLLQLTGQLEDSLKAYEALLRKQPNLVQALNNIAYLLADKLKRPAEALPYAERARQLRPGHPDVLDTLGWTYYLAGQKTRAEAVLAEAVRLGPDNIPAHLHLGRVLADAGRKAEARRVLSKARALARAAENQDYLRQVEQTLSELD